MTNKKIPERTPEQQEAYEVGLALARMFSGDDGKKVLEYWDRHFVRKPPQPSQSEAEIRTNAGKALFVLGIHGMINDVKNTRG